MKTQLIIAGILFMASLTACNSLDKIAEGIAKKNLSGNGTFVTSHIGLDPENKIPELKTTFISGDMASVLAGTNAVSFREESTSSIWNAQSVTRKRFLSITLTDTSDVSAVIQAIADVLRNAKGEQTVK